MSSLIRCDRCATELDERHNQYFTVERGGMDMLSMDEPLGPWHFCSWLCTARFAEVLDRLRADGR